MVLSVCQDSHCSSSLTKSYNLNLLCVVSTVLHAASGLFLILSTVHGVGVPFIIFVNSIFRFVKDLVWTVCDLKNAIYRSR
jgi:hypothetical protein